WMIERQANSVHTEWGRIGTAGQRKSKDYANQAAAQADYDKQVAGKLKKGYQEVGSLAASGPAPSVVRAEGATAVLEPPPTPTEPKVRPGLPDEERFEFPREWTRKLLPWPGRDECEPVRGTLEKVTRHLSADSFWVFPEFTDRAPLESRLKTWLVNGAFSERAQDEADFFAYLCFHEKVPEPLVDWLVASRGLSYAVELALLANWPAVALGGYKYEARHVVLFRLRRHLAAASPSELQAAEQVAELLRQTEHEPTRLAVGPASSFLFPLRQDWVRHDAARDTLRGDATLLFYSLTEAESAQQVAAKVTAPGDELYALLHNLGVGALPVLLEYLSKPYLEAERVGRVASMLATLPSDEALEAVFSRFDERHCKAACSEAAIRFSVRTLKLCVGNRSRASLMDIALARWPQAAALCEGVETPEILPLASSESWPKVLVDPPWLGVARSRPKPVELEPLPHQPEFVWEPGQQEQWRAVRGFTWQGGKTFEQQWADRRKDYIASSFVALAPEPLAVQALSVWNPLSEYGAADWFWAILARFQTRVLGQLVDLLDSSVTQALPLLAPVRWAQLAPAVAAALSSKTMRNEARQWLLRHPEAAALGLIPDLLGKSKKPRERAEEAIRLLVAEGHRAVVEAVAERYEVGKAVAQMLEVTPLDLFPAKRPDVTRCACYDPNLLPQLELANGAGALPPEAVEHFVTMLAFSPPDDPYVGVDLVAQALTPASRARFAWALFENWQNTGGSSKENWAFLALGWLGDDQCARDLYPLIREWPGQALHARAVLGLDVLAMIGSDEALMWLYRLSLKSKFKGLKRKAEEKIDEVAERRGLTPTQLADRLVPDLGLDERGTMLLDYGPRQFTVGFDEELKPYVLDGQGKRLKNLPKPGKSDDQVQGQEAYEAFKTLKKGVRDIASLQIQRLELAMCSQRRWHSQDFQRLLLGHPLMIHLVRRLIWGVFEQGSLKATFRVAEDGSLADRNEDDFELSPEAELGIPHRLEMSDEVAAGWGEVLADYQILQPFEQLGRQTFARSSEQARARKLDDFKQVVVPTGRILGLTSRDWQRGEAQDNGIIWWINKLLAPGHVITLVFEPGMVVGMVNEEPEQTLGSVYYM
ncbi:MAG: DUF4132 domain-containing protein, partial [Candidatus Eremiobacteraeota bacterium]|nr:DUF4132 domain-containing protein [Candidatus Eremiobacteraeota bacterium]